MLVDAPCELTSKDCVVWSQLFRKGFFWKLNLVQHCTMCSSSISVSSSCESNFLGCGVGTQFTLVTFYCCLECRNTPWTDMCYDEIYTNHVWHSKFKHRLLTVVLRHTAYKKVHLQTSFNPLFILLSCRSQRMKTQETKIMKSDLWTLGVTCLNK